MIWSRRTGNWMGNCKTSATSPRKAKRQAPGPRTPLPRCARRFREDGWRGVARDTEPRNTRGAATRGRSSARLRRRLGPGRIEYPLPNCRDARNTTSLSVLAEACCRVCGAAGVTHHPTMLVHYAALHAPYPTPSAVGCV